MKRLLVVGALLCSVLGIFILYVSKASVVEKRDSDASVKFAQRDIVRYRIGSQTYIIYTARTSQEQTQGLSGIESMEKDEGMAFIFEQPKISSFWMKDMNFPLDFVFVKDMRIIDIAENISPDSYPQTVTPRSAADTVIELNGGEMKRNGARIGDGIELR